MSAMQIDALSELVFYLFMLLVTLGAWLVGCIYGYRRCMQDALNTPRGRNRARTRRGARREMYVYHENPVLDMTTLRLAPTARASYSSNKSSKIHR